MPNQFDKSRLPSRYVSVGPERAPQRSYYYAMGMTEEEIAQPFVAVVSAGNDSAPCNTTLDFQANICREGVIQGGGTPRRFNTITVTDGIAMGHQGMRSSLASREVIADSVELSVRGHCYDAIVGFAGCDKSLPGMMMAMLRLNVPSIFVYGGSILPGRYEGRDLTVQDVFEAVGRYSSGACPLSELTAIEKAACPGHGACGGQYTANTMACVGEAIGLSLPNSNMVPAPHKSREEIAVAAGKQVMELLAKNLRPRDICTRAAFENAARVVAATGGSTNAALHLPAMANECGISFDLFDVAEIFKSTPYIADLKPGGQYVAKDMYEAGGVYMVMKTLLAEGLLDPNPMTVTGKTLGENIAEITWNPDQR
jgi:dihydroxy-acid dehydratase